MRKINFGNVKTIVIEGIIEGKFTVSESVGNSPLF